MKIAFATTDGVMVDEHFGRAGMFAVYELDGSGYRLVELRKFAEGRDSNVEGTRGDAEAHDSAVASKVERLSDCRLIYMEEIGGPSAARLSRRNIIPMKVKGTASIAENLERILETARNSPPLWLRKALES